MSSNNKEPSTSPAECGRPVVVEPAGVADPLAHTSASSAAASSMAAQNDLAEPQPVVSEEGDQDKVAPGAITSSPTAVGGASAAAVDAMLQPSAASDGCGSFTAASGDLAISPPGLSTVSVSSVSEDRLPVSVTSHGWPRGPPANEGRAPGSDVSPARQSAAVSTEPAVTSSPTPSTTPDTEESSAETQELADTPPVSVSAASDVAMTAAEPSTPALPPAGCGSSGSGDGQGMAPSGALAMLAGYSSDECGGSDSDSEGAGPAEVKPSSYVQLVDPVPASPELAAPAAGGGYVQLVDAPAADAQDISMEVPPELTVDREGLYRDSLAAPWSEDSDSDSESDSASSSSSSDSDSEPAAEQDEKEDGDETDQTRRVFGPMTKGELCLLDLPPIEHLHIVLPEEQCTRVGAVASVVDCLVVIQSTPGSPALDIDSVLFLECGRRPLGRVYDVMGPVSEAAYCVRFNTPEEIQQFGVKPGADVYYAPGSPDYSHFVFVEALRKMRGSDASWWDSNEPPESCLDFSDDEEERHHKRQNRKRPLQATSESGGAPAGGTDRPTCSRPDRGRGRGQGQGQGQGQGRGRGRGRGGQSLPPWMPAPPRNPFYGHHGTSLPPPPRWRQPPPPPPGPFSRPPPPPPGAFGQPPPPFSAPPPFCPPSIGVPGNQRPLPGPPPGGPPTNQPPPWIQSGFWGGR